ncbi:MAG: hypothetical protein AB1762_20855 [Gemmatimonadota bacterium]
MSAALSIVVAACGRTNLPDTSDSSAATNALATRAPFLVKVDHFYATSSDAERHFTFFRDTLGLAVAWAYTDYGGFASGGLSAGNSVIEFVKWTVAKGEILPTEWKAIAFEPLGGTETLVLELARRGFKHSAPDTSRYRDSAGNDVVGWTNTDLTGLSPSGTVFICDYADRKAISENRAAAKADLARRNGGPLGVIAVNEIVLEVTDVVKAAVQWRSLAGSTASESDRRFSFGDGPDIRLVGSERDGIKEIVIGVRSIAAARRFLTDRGLLEGEDGGRVAIAPRVLGGLRVTLVERDESPGT